MVKAAKVKSVKKVDKINQKDDISLVEESFHLIKKLNEQVGIVKKSKDNLVEKIEKLDSKITNHEKNNKNKLFNSIKNEIIQDFEPLLKKFNTKSLRNGILLEIEKLIELELCKLKSEINSKNNKIKKVLSSNIGELEIKVLDGTKKLKEVEKIIKNIDANEKNEILEEINLNISKAIKKENSNFKKLLSNKFLEVVQLKEVIEKQERKIKLFKTKFIKLINQDSEKFIEIKSELDELTKINYGFNESLNEQYKKINLIKDTIKKPLNNWKLEKKNLEKFLLEKSNQLLENLNDFENRLIKIEKQDSSKLNEEIQKKLNIEIENFKIKTDFFFNDTLKKLTLEKEGIESSISDYVKNIEKEFKEIKKSQKKFELKDSKLFSKYEQLFKSENKKIENNFGNFNKKVLRLINNGNLQIKNISDEKDALEQFIIEKTNEVISNVNSFENKLNKIEKKDKKYLIDFIKKSYNEQKEILKIDNKNISNELILRIDENIKFVNSNSLNKVKNSIKDLESFKLELSKLIKNYIIEVDKKIQENSQLEDKINEKLSKDINSLKVKFSDIENDKNLKVENIFKIIEEIKTSSIEENKEIISKEIFKINNFLSKITFQTKENQTQIEEDIENKFLTSKDQYEEQFSAHLSNFDYNLKLKESDFLNKLGIIENDKNLMIDELNNFKSEIGILTKDYMNKLDSEFQKIKTEEKNFSIEKEEFSNEIKVLVEEKKEILTNYSLNIEKNFIDLIKSEKEKFEIHENTFREVFNEKISNLQNLTKQKLELIEKKFVDKNLKEVDKKINSQIKIIEIVRGELESKEMEISKKIENLDLKIVQNFEDLDSKKEEISEKSELRLTNLEKQLNKRFLDYDSDFSNFKTVIIDEVEGLIKDVNNLISSKVEKFDKNIAKSNFINTEASNKILDMNNVHNLVEEELKSIRDEINDIRVKMDILNYSDINQPLSGINEHVKYMSEYENQLIALIKNLKTRGVSDDKIFHVLINKGHPRFYVSMIIENYSHILNL